jgi:hypothetical protein
VPVIERSRHELASFVFRSIRIDPTNLTIDFLSATYGKAFLCAQCCPTTYLLFLTDRLKSFSWTNHRELFTGCVTLDSHLIIVLNEDPSLIGHVRIALNMDLYCQSIDIETLDESSSSVYTIADVIEKTIAFVDKLSFDEFQPINLELTRKRLVRTHIDNELSESEYLDKQIRHLQILDRRQTSMITTVDDMQLNCQPKLDEYELIRPEICTSCFRDMNETIPMIALKTCGHWTCHDCWKTYLESSIKLVKIVLCPEWNCNSIVDIGEIKFHQCSLTFSFVDLLSRHTHVIDQCSFYEHVSTSTRKVSRQFITFVRSMSSEVLCEYCAHC